MDAAGAVRSGVLEADVVLPSACGEANRPDGVEAAGPVQSVRMEAMPPDAVAGGEADGPARGEATRAAVGSRRRPMGR